MNIQTSFSYPFLISYPSPSHLLNLKEIRGLKILQYDPFWTEEEGKGVPGEVHEDFRGTECIGTILGPRTTNLCDHSITSVPYPSTQFRKISYESIISIHKDEASLAKEKNKL